MAGRRVPAIQNNIMIDQTTNAAAGANISVFMKKPSPSTDGEGGAALVNCQM
jgi:hypothetical protein